MKEIKSQDHLDAVARAGTPARGLAREYANDGSLEVALEALVDAHGLTRVVSTLSVICGEKADHLRSNWQDDRSAKLWEADGRVLDRAARGIKSDGGE